MTRYRADPPALRRAVPLDDGMTLIFHRPSATTHLVASPVPEIFRALEEGAATAEQVLQRLAESYELEQVEADAMAVSLKELADLGLVTGE